MSQPSNPFSRAEYASRLEKLRSEMDRLRLDAVLVSAPENTFWLSGYHTKAVFTFQFLLIHRSRPAHLVTRQMEIVNARLACTSGLLEGFTVYQDDDDPMVVATKAIREVAGDKARVGIELGSWSMPAQRAQAIAELCPGITWHDVSTLIDRMRLVKSDAEIEQLKQAAVIGDAMADKACAVVAEGRTENDIAKVVMSELATSGSEYPGSWPNIMVGRRTGLIHAAWEGEKLGRNDHALMEVTGVKQRYHAPSVRVVFVGDPPGGLRRAAEALTKAHTAAIAAIAPGRAMKVVNEAAQAALAGQDLGCTVGHRAGYSLGIGFPPSWGAQWQIGLNSKIEDPLEVGMAFHVNLIGHFPDGRAVGIGCTVALLKNEVARLTKGGIYDPKH